MQYAHGFLVPEYYARFECKGGACRSTCCRGWNISVSMKDYYKLLGLECSKTLRRQLDCAFHPAQSPDEERFAVLSPRWDGDCPLHREDGYCALQKECGENALSQVCRYYPRSAKTEGEYQCACSNSCEAVLEMLFSIQEPLAFRIQPLSFDLPESRAIQNAGMLAWYHEIRRGCVAILQNRTLTLAKRFALLGAFIEKIAPPLREKNEDLIAAALRADMPIPEIEPVGAENLLMEIVEMARSCNSHSVGPYIEEALQNAPDRAAYEARLPAFRRLYPKWDIYAEQMLVNHAFYECFPFSDRNENMQSDLLSFLAAYALVRYLAVCEAKGGLDSLVDVCAAAFRYIEHSAFGHNVGVIDRKGGYGSLDWLRLASRL